MDAVSNPQQAEEKAKQTQRKIREYKATLLTIVVSVVALCLWSPFFIATVLSYILGNTPVVQTLLNFAVGIGICNSAVNFFVYALMNKELRLGFAKVWGIKLKTQNNQPGFSLNQSIT
jgi:hypothetical protein